MNTTKKISKALDKYRPLNLSDRTKKEIRESKLKVGSKVRLTKKAGAFDRNINNQFRSHTIGGVIKDSQSLLDAIHFYMVGLDLYKSAKILKFNDNASGSNKPEVGVYLEFTFTDGKKLTSWYYLKDVVKMK